MNKIFKVFVVLFFVFISCICSVNAENIYFANNKYELNLSDTYVNKGVVTNDYYLNGEYKDHWSNLISISYYPEVNSPIKFSNDFDKRIEANDKCVLLKFVQNKKQNIAVISYLENVEQNGKFFFVYNIYKYEKHPDKGMMALRYAKKYEFMTNEEIKHIASEVKEINNDYMEQIIIAPIPPIVDKSVQN